MEFDIRFESSAKLGYVGVLANAARVKGLVASQNAGSSNVGIYYQVGGAGLNGKFTEALGSSCDAVNRLLIEAYDRRFGTGTWQTDSAAGRTDRLTSLYIPLPRPRPQDATIGDRVAGMVYSVGPMLDGTIKDRDAFRRIYIDAFEAAAAANHGAASVERIEALRITMLSTGIYGGTKTDAEATLLARDVAALVLEALVAAAKGAAAADLPGTILVNTAFGANPSKEVDAFCHASAARGAAVSPTGFTIDVS